MPFAYLSTVAFLLASASVPETQATQTVPKAYGLGALDDAVLSTVFVDLLTYTGEDSAVVVRGVPPRTIEVAPAPGSWPLTPDSVLFQLEATPWKKLTSQETAALEGAAAHVVARHDAPQSPRQPLIPDTRVRFVVPEEGGDIFEDRPIRYWLPGYSSRMRLAIVVLSVPWSIHSCDATYVLAQSDSGWVIRLRQFVYSL